MGLHIGRSGYLYIFSFEIYLSNMWVIDVCIVLRKLFKTVPWIFSNFLLEAVAHRHPTHLYLRTLIGWFYKIWNHLKYPLPFPTKSIRITRRWRAVTWNASLYHFHICHGSVLWTPPPPNHLTIYYNYYTSVPTVTAVSRRRRFVASLLSWIVFVGIFDSIFPKVELFFTFSCFFPIFVLFL